MNIGKLVCLAGLAILLLAPRGALAVTPLTPEEQEVKRLLLDDLRKQDEAIVRGDPSVLRAIYALPKGNDAYRHALARRDFLSAWQRVRGVHVDAVRVQVRTPRIRFGGGGEVRVTAIVSEEFSYHHLYGQGHLGRFGLGTRRWYILVRDADRLRIRSEDFTDPLDQDTRIAGEALPSRGDPSHALSTKNTPVAITGSERAVRYADRYCGAAPGCGNGRRYHPSYADFNGEGGDCTNFISQSLRAAGFRRTDAWAWDASKFDGTRAWSNAQALVDYLDASGRGTIYASGDYADVVRSTRRFPHGAVSELRSGDVIAYYEQGRIVHLALVVDRNDEGYVLVNSHTSDRYHVPWDIGWDRKTRFHLIHIHYRSQPPGTQGLGVRSQMPLEREPAFSPPISRRPPGREAAAP